MKLDIKNNNIAVSAINFVFVFLCLSMSINLFTVGISQKIFYLSGYVCFFLTVAYLIFDNTNRTFSRVKIGFVLAVLLIGLVRLAWVIYIQHTEPHLSANATSILKNYFLGGKRFVLGAFVISAIMLFGRQLKSGTVGICRAIVFCGMLVTLGFGIHEYFFVTHTRIKLTADAASSSSYMVVFIYCAYLWLSRSNYYNKSRLVDLLFVGITFALIILCGTRVSILSFIMVTIYHLNCAFGLSSLLRKKRNLFVGACAIIAVFSLSAERWYDGLENIENYNKDSSTSIGARVAIWESGVDFIERNSGFSSPDKRTETAREFIEEKHPKNRIGYTNVKFNMHNEFLEVFTLQGWLGFLSLTLLYITFLYGKIFNSDVRGIALPVIALFISGLTDSVLIYGQTVMLFVIVLGICSLKIPHAKKTSSQIT